MSYQSKLKNPLWQRKRLEVFNRDSFCCQLCKDDKSELHVHHLKYNGEPWQSSIDDLQTLCAKCHYAVSSLGKETKDIYVKVKSFAGKHYVYHRDTGVADLWLFDGDNDPAFICAFNERSKVIEYIYKNLQK